MNSPNAFGFLGLGILMQVLPDVAPSLIGHAALATQSTGALWMEFMSYVVVGIGGGHFVHQGAQRLSVLLGTFLPATRAAEPLAAKPVAAARLASSAQA